MHNVNFSKRLKKYIKDKEGAILPVAAISLPVLLSVVALGTDASYFVMKKKDLQTAIDAASLAAAWEISKGSDKYMLEAAVREAIKNGYDPEKDGILTLEVSGYGYNYSYSYGYKDEDSEEDEDKDYEDDDDDHDEDKDYEDDDDDHDEDKDYEDDDDDYGEDDDNDLEGEYGGEGNVIMVTATLSQDVDTFFSSLIFSDPPRVGVKAKSIITGMDGEYCILALEKEHTAVSLKGSLTLNSENCGIAANSSSETAIKFKGDANVNVSNINIVGDYNIEYGSVDFEYSDLKTGALAIPDPYKNLEVPEHTECSESEMEKGLYYNSDVVLSPGVYCGGINLSGNSDVEFEPGIYIIEGGKLDISGTGTLYGEGVTFVLTGSEDNYARLDVTGNREIEFIAPVEGEEMEGIVFFQDRKAPTTGNIRNRLLSNRDISIRGVSYFPSQKLYFGGNSEWDSDSECTKIIARKVAITGNPALGNNCEGTGVKPIGSPIVRLYR